MKHEHFKLFRVPETNVENDTDLLLFLNSGEITPRSLSIEKYYMNQVLIVIGYEKIKSERVYNLVEATIYDIVYKGLSTLGTELEKKASEIGGVICHDIAYAEESVHVTFLTTK